MRALWRDAGWGSEVGGASLKLDRILTLPTALASRRDFWIRFASSSGVSTVAMNIFPTRAEARAGVAAGRLGSGTFSAAGTVDVTVADQAENPPDLDGMVVRVVNSIGTAEHYSVWGYSASPEFYVAQDIVAILQEYAIPGGMLEGFDSTNILVGPDVEQHPVAQINVVPTSVSPFEFVSSGNREFHGAEFGFTILIQQSLLSDTINGYAFPGPVEAAWMHLRYLADQVCSIIGDARRTLYGAGPMNSLIARVSEQPSFEGEEDRPFMAISVDVTMPIHNMWTEYEE